MKLTVFQLLGGEAAGLTAAVAVLVVGGIVVARTTAADVDHANARAIALGVVTVVAILLAIGSLRHLVTLRRISKHYPPPGKMVEVFGHRMHVLAEGPTDRGPTIVWLPGGHVGGFAMHHLHSPLSKETRSVLLDRFGTGWSDAGPFPRTTRREVDEVMHALERSGEKGPYIFVGHSFGGLLVANIARRHPDLVHTVVLLDPTPLEVIFLGPRLGGLRRMHRDAIWHGLRLLVGLDRRHARDRELRREEGTAHVVDAWKTALGDAGVALRAVDGATAGSAFASASIYRELDPRELSEHAWQTVVYDGDLGDLPVLLVAPKNQIELDVLPEAKAATSSEVQRMSIFFARVRERYMATSSRAMRIVAPEGTGHNFVYEVPEFVVGLMCDLVRGRASDEMTLKELP